MKTDAQYRAEMLAAGVRPDLIATLTGHDLDLVGNLVDVYRTTMQEQNPHRYAILQHAKGQTIQ